jgi:hypothetical protein
MAKGHSVGVEREKSRLGGKVQPVEDALERRVYAKGEDHYSWCSKVRADVSHKYISDQEILHRSVKARHFMLGTYIKIIFYLPHTIIDLGELGYLSNLELA